jgi:hypothetical protein
MVVQIDQGVNAEIRTIAAFGSIVVDRPLLAAHLQNTAVAVFRPDALVRGAALQSSSSSAVPVDLARIELGLKQAFQAADADKSGYVSVDEVIQLVSLAFITTYVL